MSQRGREKVPSIPHRKLSFSEDTCYLSLCLSTSRSMVKSGESIDGVEYSLNDSEGQESKTHSLPSLNIRSGSFVPATFGTVIEQLGAQKILRSHVKICLWISESGFVG